MKTTNLASILFLVVAASFTATASAQKPAPKPAEYTSRDDVIRNETLNRDFRLQGEYRMTIGEQPFGAHAVAEGDGKFRVVIFVGGLPGDGWRRGDIRILGKAEVNTDGDLDVVLEEIESAGERTKMEPQQNCVSKIDGDKVWTTDPNGNKYTFEKVERKSPTEGLAAPEDAVVLFADGKKNEAMWNRGNVNTETGTLWAEAETKPFDKKPYTLHVEFMLSYMPTARGQARSNSGVYIDQAYECQVLDSFGLDGKNNECGGFYRLAEPKVNMCFPPLQWQTYDIDFVPAAFDAEGKKTADAIITIHHNGVRIHDNIEPKKETPGCKKEGPETRGLYLQGHGNKVQYRNIWIKYND